MKTRKPYPSDVSNEEWAFVAPYLALVRPDAKQRRHDLREVVNALRYLVRTGVQGRYLPGDLPPWPAVYQQTQRWLAHGVFEAMVHDLLVLLRLATCRGPAQTASILDSRTMQSTPEKGSRAGYDGAKRKKGTTVHAAVDTLGHLLTTLANEQNRHPVGALTKAVQEVTGSAVEIAFVDQGYSGERPLEAAKANGIELELVKLPETGHGFVLLPRRWVVERSFAWVTRFRRLAKDYERLSETLWACTFWPSPA